MKVLVTGATGFIGYHVIHELLTRGAEVIATSGNEEKAKSKDWYSKVKFVQHKIGDESQVSLFTKFLTPDFIIHLAWEGLPNYKELYHFEKNLMQQYFFIRQLVNDGAADITITGTCFEYGMKEGPLDVSMPADPQNPYALAKDTLRKFLQQLQLKNKFNLKWLRLFYMYGKGQSEKSLFSQLDKALAEKAPEFNMSGGEQVRDYLPVEAVASEIADTAINSLKNGIYNCCSGQPVSVKSLVQKYLSDKKETIKLNLGYYPYNDYEPMAFWGVK